MRQKITGFVLIASLTAALAMPADDLAGWEEKVLGKYGGQHYGF